LEIARGRATEGAVMRVCVVDLLQSMWGKETYGDLPHLLQTPLMTEVALPIFIAYHVHPKDIYITGIRENNAIVRYIKCIGNSKCTRYKKTSHLEYLWC
jgi:hypothetical protein